MVTLTFDGKDYLVRNELTELTIKDFEHISSIMSDSDKMQFEKWSDILVYLGIPQEEVDLFDTEDFIKTINMFNISNIEDTSIVKEIIIDELVYKAFEEEFKLTVKEASLIESYIKKNNERYFGEIMAVIYKREDIDKAMHYDSAHIHYKAELIRKNVTADKVMPLLGLLTKKLVKDYNKINEVTE